MCHWYITLSIASLSCCDTWIIPGKSSDAPPIPEPGPDPVEAPVSGSFIIRMKASWFCEISWSSSGLELPNCCRTALSILGSLWSSCLIWWNISWFLRKSKGLSEADSLLGVVGAACAAGVVDSPEGGLEGAADAGEGTTGRESSPSPNDGGIPVKRYSTALSGLL